VLHLKRVWLKRKKNIWGNDMIYYADQNGSTIRLLQTGDYKKYKLSTLRTDEGTIQALVNFPFFNSSHIVGRYQGDERNDTVDQENFKGNNIVIFKDNTYKIGKFNSWDYQNIDDIAGGFCPSAVVLKGKSIEISETIKEQGQYSSTAKINRTAICYDGEYHFIVGETLSVNALLNAIKSKYPNYEFIALGDSGGSSELIVNGLIQNSLQDGAERPNYCGLAFIKSNTPTAEKLFCPRFSKDGMKDNKYWYDTTYNAGASGDIMLPNCVTYASGRLSEETGENMRNIMKGRTGFGNACEWYDQTTLSKGSTPKLGAIACFGGTLGHVAVVEQINEDGSVVVSQSNYQAKKDYNSSNYFQTKTYTLEVGKVTTGVGLKFLGYIYAPNLKYSVDRDKTKDQVEILAERLKIRKSANGDWNEGIFASCGIYDILEIKTEGDYTWAKLDTDCWVALNDSDGWTKTYLKEDTPTEPTTDWEKLYKEMESKYNTLENDYKTLGTENANLNTELKQSQTELSAVKADYEAVKTKADKLSETLAKIKEIVQ
jgi:surface antigen